MSRPSPHVDDAALPPGTVSPLRSTAARADVSYTSAVWTPESLALLCDHLTDGAAALVQADADSLRSGWEQTVAEFLPGRGEIWGRLEPALTHLCGLSPAGLRAGVEAVLGGVVGAPLRRLFEDAERCVDRAPQPPLLVVLSSNLPALAVQPLAAALALRRPVLVKSASSEPLFAPAFVGALGERLPTVQRTWAAITWPGGEARLERPILERVKTILAYGESASIDDLAARAVGRVVGYGPKLSCGFVRRGAPLEAVAGGLARDIALFDQRGCLSVQAVLTEGEPTALAEALAEALRAAAERWPPGPLDPAAAARVHALRAESDMRGLPRPALPLDVGTVVVEPERRLRPSPGLRTVTIHPVRDEADLVQLLTPWRDRLQGLAVAGELAPATRAAVAELGVTRIAEPGRLQDADALWHNGGVHPLERIGTAR